MIGEKILYKIIKRNKTKDPVCTACIVLNVGVVSLWLRQYPVLLANIMGLPASRHVETYMLLYTLSFLIYLSPLFFINNKWKTILLNISFILLSFVLAHHYIDVINSPHSYLDLNNHNPLLNLKEFYV